MYGYQCRAEMPSVIIVPDVYVIEVEAGLL